MLEIYPHLAKAKYTCPACKCQLSEPTSLFFQGQHVLADIVCTCCDIPYYHTFPVGFGASFPIAFTKDGKTYKCASPDSSVAKTLIHSMITPNEYHSEVEVTKYWDASKVIVLNCLDENKGRSLLKMLNAQNHLDKHNDYGLIMLVPASLKWFVPDGVAETWSINAPFTQFKKKINGLDNFIKNSSLRYEQVALSEASISPDTAWVDLSRFTKSVYLSKLSVNNKFASFFSIRIIVCISNWKAFYKTQ